MSSDELKEAKALAALAASATKDAKEESRSTLEALRDQEREAEMARLRAESVEAAGDEPVNLENDNRATSEQKAQRSRERSAWAAKKAAKAAAAIEAKRQEGVRDQLRAAHKTAVAAEKAAMQAAKPFEAGVQELYKRFAKKRGITLPLPFPMRPDQQPTPPP